MAVPIIFCQFLPTKLINRFYNISYNLQIMPNFKKEHKTESKMKLQSFDGSESHESEQDSSYAGDNYTKKQTENNTPSNNIPEKSESVVDPSRQNRKIEILNKSKIKSKKRAKQNGPPEADQMIKKQQRKRSAAPPELINDGSNSSSLQSQKSQKSQQEKAAPDQPKQSLRLYIGNLPVSFSENQMKKLFKKFGHLKQIKLMINSTTGKSKGFGFVQYTNIESAIKAKQQLGTHILDGQKISIQFCEMQ